MKLVLMTLALVLLAGSASAADWMKDDGGTKTCGSMSTGKTCWLSSISEDSSVINMANCGSWTIMVYGSSSVVMPQACTDSACGTAEDLLASALTGTSPDAFATSAAPFGLLRIDWTSGNPTISIMCGG